MPSTGIFLSSVTASSKTANGGEFSVNIGQPIVLPKGSRPRIAVLQASIWNTFPSVSADQGNNIIYYSDDNTNPSKYSITLVDGAYEVSDFNRAIAYGLALNGHAATLITLGEITATGRVSLTIDRAGYLSYWPSNTAWSRLGFTLNQRFPASGLTSAATTYIGSNVANISPVNNLYISCSMASGETVVSGKAGSVIAQVNPNVAAGSLIAYQPSYPQFVDCTKLDGYYIDNIVMRLINENGALVDTGGEDWSVNICLETIDT